jgi:hypothetical protein
MLALMYGYVSSKKMREAEAQTDVGRDAQRRDGGSPRHHHGYRSVSSCRSGPSSLRRLPGVSAVLGWFLLLGLLFSMQDYEATITSSTGQPVTQIFLDTVGEKGAIVLMVCFISP